MRSRLRTVIARPRFAAHTDPAGERAVANDAEWPAQATASRVSVRPLTAVLSVALIGTLGVWGGAELHERENPSSAAGSGPLADSGPLSGFPGRGNGGGIPTATGSFTAGTVTAVKGKTLYLTSASGALVKVQMTAATTYTRTAKTSSTGLKVGDSAIVQGAKNAAGTTVATSVTATAKGITGGMGGFGPRANSTAPTGTNTPGG